MYNLQRKSDMIEMRQGNATLAEIGIAFGVSRERVRQIIGNTGRHTRNISNVVMQGRHGGAIRKPEDFNNILSYFFCKIDIPGRSSEIPNIEEVDFDKCWIWNGVRTREGYGHLVNKEYSHFYAHRFSYLLFYGSIPEGLKICHSCDNPWCVNPEHLWAGTQNDNVQDAVRKGRFKKLGRTIAGVGYA